MIDDINKFKVLVSNSIKEAVSKMDDAGIGFCVCVDTNDKVVGVISDGDFRRAVLRGQSLDVNVEEIVNKNYIFIAEGCSDIEVQELFLNTVAQHIPVVSNGYLIDIVSEESFFGFEKIVNRTRLTNSVVIMAGGKGKRLDPFTRILPKPLIPLGDEPIIKVIMEQFVKFGIDDFHISLNDKGRMVKAYFHDHELPYNINYIEEDMPLGTAGALKYLQGKFDQPFFVSNCDIIINTDYSSIMQFHMDGKHDITLVASMRHYVIPYGVCNVDEVGGLKGINEKPEYDFLVNTGLYIINPDVLGYIPNNKHYDMTDLINEMKNEKMSVGVFPVSEKSWSDVGQWEEYNETFKNFTNQLKSG